MISKSRVLVPVYRNLLGQAKIYNSINRSLISIRSYSDEAPKKEKLGLKDLIKKYGLPAFILYNAISAVDLSITFSLLHFGGEEQVLYLETKVRELFHYFGYAKQAEPIGKPSFWTTFAVAYSIHKLLLPIRVPITAAFTPAFAKKLQALGWIKPKV